MPVAFRAQLHRLVATGVVALVVSLALGVALVSAQEAGVTTDREEITLSPVSKQHSVKPGQTVRGDFKVVNSGQTTYDFTVYTRPFSVKNITYEQDFQTLTERSKAYSWVQFEQTEWRLEPGEVATVEYTLRVPDSATPGGHYGVLFAETKPQEGASDSVVRKKRVGSVLRVAVDGDINLEGAYVGGSTSFLQFRPPLETTTQIKNTGNVDFDTELVLTVKDLFGNAKHRAKQDVTIYPETTRETSFNWESVNWFGLYKVEVQAKFLDESHTRERLVLMAPRWLLVVGLIGLVGGGYALFRHRR